MKFNLDQAMELLSRTPDILRAWLSGVDAAWTHSSYGPDTFSPFDVVGHLVHGEKTDWIPRARLILCGEDRPFEPFDRYAMFATSNQQTMADRLAEFATLRAANLTELRNMRVAAAQLAMPGRHPALGPVTLEQLLSTWVVHDLNHLAQIAKAMAYQYNDAVGPWRAYLSILRDFQT